MLSRQSLLSRAAAPALSTRLVDTRAAGSRGRSAAAGGAGASGEAEGEGRAASAPLDELASTHSAPALAKRRHTASTAEPAPPAKRSRSGETAVGLPLRQPRLNVTTGFRGVRFNKQTGKYQATLSFNGQHISCVEDSDKNAFHGQPRSLRTSCRGCA